MNTYLLSIHQVFTCSPFDCFLLYRVKGWMNTCEHLKE
nr:MAG TPA: hypothetical protein [Caudoviricetes sp.]